MQMGTMTTKITESFNVDVFHDSNWPLFDLGKALDDNLAVPDISLIEISAERARSSAELDALVEACGDRLVHHLASMHSGGYKFWLFMTTECWEEPSRLVRYRGLWKNMTKRFPLLADISVKSEEISIESKSGIRFAGVLQFQIGELLEMLKLSRNYRSCVILLSRDTDVDSVSNLNYLYTSSFPDENYPSAVDWGMLALTLCPKEYIIIRVTGHFDDPEASVNAIALHEIAKRMFAALDPA